MPDDTIEPLGQGVVPDLKARTVVAIFHQVRPAEAAVQALYAAGFAAGDVSLVRKDEGARPELGVEETQTAKGAVAGVSAGTLVGGAVGLAALAIPGIGPLIAAGPIVMIIAGGVTGGALGGLVGSFGGLGIPTERARAYEEAVRAGGIFVAVKTPDRAAADRATALLTEHGAHQATDFTAEM